MRNAFFKLTAFIKSASFVKATKTGSHLDKLWIAMIAMTLLNAFIAERAEPSLAITLIICAMVIVKARLVIDHFMELKEASPYIYHLMNAYFYVFPILAVLVWLYPEVLADLTRFKD